MNPLLITVPSVIRITVRMTGAVPVIVLGCSTAAVAQGLPGPLVPPIINQASLARITADLAYPSSSQRFFEAGKAQFEEEIRRLSNDDEQSEPLLTVKPDVLKQFED